MKFAKLTDLGGNLIWLNPANVTAVRLPASGESEFRAKAAIILSSGGTIDVTEDPQTAVNAVEAAG